MSHFLLLVNKGTELSFLAGFSLFVVVLALVRFVLVGVVERLKLGVRQLAGVLTAKTLLFIVVGASFSGVVELVRSSSVVKGFVGVDAVVPVVVLRLVGTPGSLVSVEIEHERVYDLEVLLQSLLKSLVHVWLQVEHHLVEILN